MSLEIVLNIQVRDMAETPLAHVGRVETTINPVAGDWGTEIEVARAAVETLSAEAVVSLQEKLDQYLEAHRRSEDRDKR